MLRLRARRRTCGAFVAVAMFAVAMLLTPTKADDVQPAMPAEVNAALQRMVAAQQSGDLNQYADTLASPVAEVFRLHADSATKVGEAKRHLEQAIRETFGQLSDPNAFSYAFDDTQLKARLEQLVFIQIDKAGASGNNWKLQVTTTIRTSDGSTRQLPQGFIAIEYGNTWKVQDLAIASHLASLKKGAETNWAIYRMFNSIADDVKAGKFKTSDEPLTFSLAAYNKITGKDAAPPQGGDEYVSGVKAFDAGDFVQSLALFKQSAAKGYPHAATMVGRQCAAGEGTREDANAAAEWFGKDLPDGDPTAENLLGSMLLEGDGLPKNPVEGLRLLNLAADQDDPSGILNVGRAYLFGLGVPKDESKGMELYNRAAALGNEQAAYFVKWLGQSPGNRSFKDQAQATAYQQIQLLRANALSAEQNGFRADGSFRPADSRLAANLRAQADQLARDNGLE